jgi:hypothetical protein
MKTILLVTLFQLVSLLVQGQTLFDLYRKLPGKDALLGNVKSREQMIQNFKNGKGTGDLYVGFDVVDEKNGFLNITGAFEGIWEMCYWNMANNIKLVAVYQQECGPVCAINVFKFYRYENDKLVEEQIHNVIPEYEDIYDAFFIDGDTSKKKLDDQDIIATLLFRLPRKGKDIIAMFGNEESKDTYSKFAKGDAMLLKWDNGKFKKDKIYWKE